MKLLRRKTDKFLKKWRENENRMPLIVKGARQIGKTASIMQFANSNYKNVVAINFVLQQKYKAIFDEGYDVDSITRALTFIDPFIKLEQGNTLIFFDEMQDCPACATSLKAFKIDERYDVICSGSLMGINYREIENPTAWDIKKTIPCTPWTSRSFYGSRDILHIFMLKAAFP